jgi:hypothetical protein
LVDIPGVTHAPCSSTSSTSFRSSAISPDREILRTTPFSSKVWTGEKQGEEVLEGYDILLEKGVVRKISRSGEIALDLKEVDEVELHGAWDLAHDTLLEQDIIPFQHFLPLLLPGPHRPVLEQDGAGTLDEPVVGVN